MGEGGKRVRVLLVSCYELGHQPFTLASPWAQLERAGFEVAGADTSLAPLDDGAIAGAALVAISVPMHTAVRLGASVARRARAVNPGAHVCFYGLYAALNAAYLLDEGIADSVIGGEFEAALVALAEALERDAAPDDLASEGVVTRQTLVRVASRGLPAPPVLRRLPFANPERSRLPSLDRYARLVGPRRGEERVVGYVEASRGCLHRCLHCPVTPVYRGRFFIVPKPVVLADAEQQIAAGARHITFGDPDFLNGVSHSLSVVRGLHALHPEVTFDVTTKVELILRHREVFRELAGLGCVFVVSAVESLSDRVLAELQKGHMRADVLEALGILRDAGIPLRPSLVAFTPWTTLDDYLELTDFVIAEGLEDSVDPIQLAIRLLIPPGSALLDADRERTWLGPLVADEFGHRWTHPDPRMDRLHGEVSRVVEAAAASSEDARVTFAHIRALAYEAAGRAETAILGREERAFVPHLTEPWFCCAEPTAAQLEQVSDCSQRTCCS